MSQQSTEFDIVPVAPHVDLVLFDNVISCYSSAKDITANYTLGKAVKPSTWDWVGIFRCDWRYLGEYVAYRWAPERSADCTAPRRRGLVIPRENHQIKPDKYQQYQLLYISKGNHVVGVSSTFRVDILDDDFEFFLAVLYKEPTQIIPSRKRKSTRKSKAKTIEQSLWDTYEVVNELAGPSIPKRRAVSGKQKVIHVYKDPNTLVDFPAGWTDNLRFVQPMVKEYETSIVPYNTPLKVFEIDWSKFVSQNGASTSSKPDLFNNNTLLPTTMSIEYPNILSIKAGPQSFLQLLRKSTDDCKSCKIAKTIISDLIEKEHMHELKCLSINGRVDELQKENAAKDKSVKQIHDEFNEALCAHTRELNFSSASSNVDEEYNQWTIIQPKRIARMKKIVGKQSRAIFDLQRVVENKNEQITKLQQQTRSLKMQLQTTHYSAENFRRLSEQLNTRLRSVLYERAKDHTNEWRQFIRRVQDVKTTQTLQQNNDDSNMTSANATNKPEAGASNAKPKSQRHHLKNKQISKLMKSERQPRSKLHKERYQAEQCPTCGLKFSMKADRRVIEEHMVFHDRFES